MKKPSTAATKSQWSVDVENDQIIDVASYNVLLPCRSFDIAYKVALLGRVSLTAEFLLRLIKSADGIPEEAAASFFGFDRRDMSFVVSEVEELGFIHRRDGCLWLTAAGMGLFRGGSGNPEIFAVESVKEKADFDLISLAPQKFRFLNEFEAALLELKISDQAQASSAAGRIPSAFNRFYFEIMSSEELEWCWLKTIEARRALNRLSRLACLPQVING